MEVISSKVGYKTINGKRQKYVYVKVKDKGKTKTKGYKYRGGFKKVYENEAKLPQGKKYIVDYKRNTIITREETIDKLVKEVRKRRTQARKDKKPKKILAKPEFRLPVVKRPIRAITPLHAMRIVDAMKNKVFYTQDHSITEFSNPINEKKFLRGILQQATGDKKAAARMEENFQKIALKFSYAVEVRGVNAAGQEERVAAFSAVGMRPLQIMEMVREAGLAPSESAIDLAGYGRDYGRAMDSFERRGIKRGQLDLSLGKYRISSVKVTVKFYNNPQKDLRKYTK